ncbi:MAG: hypothetical protein JST50_04470 [Bacteroidetes bacterium]|jgi:hypothetical protein|nr:hypothetical protein [Bacteroidota bacterium]
MRIQVFLEKGLMLGICLLLFIPAKAQHSGNEESSYADSLMGSFRNSIYSRIYNPAFWSKSTKPAFTMIKISIDINGKVSNIKFSDSADTLFLKTFLSMPKHYNDIAILEKYAAIKSYKNVSILVPVSYEPGYNPNHNYSYSNLQSLMKFDKKDLVGEVIITPPIIIGVLNEHNM